MCRKAPSLALFLIGFLLPLGAHGFGFQNVVDKAKALSQQPYQAPAPIPKFLQNLSFAQYQNIRFNPNGSLWQDNRSRFQVMLVPPGLYYTHAVKLHILDANGVHDLPFDKSKFSYPSNDVEQRIPPNLGYAGFKLTYPINRANEQDQFLVFAGASYFRGVGRGNTFGLSARGIAVNTGLPAGEEFPSFIEYWLERPKASADNMRLYGLLNGKSLTGAYSFSIYPGVTTVVQVKAVLFPRNAIDLLGAAPLTSMFYYGENTPRPKGEWRRQVHDSDGLLIHNGASGEWLWRPLIDPKMLKMDYFQTENVRGFGLLQRDEDFQDYEDLGAHYEQRPSAWVKPVGDWGKGSVVLVELPTDTETNDNIVAFWSPGERVKSNQPLSLSYTLSFGSNSIAEEPLAYASNTFVGDGSIIGGGTAKGAYRIVVDFRGGPLDAVAPNGSVDGTVTALQGGTVLEHFVEYVAATRSWRLSILARPQAKDKPLQLRAYLSKGGQTLSETWSYELPVDSDILTE